MDLIPPNIPAEPITSTCELYSFRQMQITTFAIVDKKTSKNTISTHVCNRSADRISKDGGIRVLVNASDISVRQV